MGHTIIKGNNVEEMFASADKALSHLERSIRARSIVAPLTPIVIMGYCNQADDGVIFKGMFPLTGFITRVSLFIEKLDDEEAFKKDGLKFQIRAEQVDGTLIAKTFLTRKLSISEFVSFKVAADSRVSVVVNIKAFGVWYGFIMEPEVSIKRKVDISDIDVLSPIELNMIGE